MWALLDESICLLQMLNFLLCELDDLLLLVAVRALAVVQDGKSRVGTIAMVGVEVPDPFL